MTASTLSTPKSLALLDSISTELSFAQQQSCALKRWDLSEHAWISYEPSFLADHEANRLMETLIDEEDWEQRAIQVFGKPIDQPRLISWGGNMPYRYSGQTLAPREVFEALKPLWQQVEQACGTDFNHVLLNYYRDGKDYMGMHADDETELGLNPVIAAISLGVTRRFVVAPKQRKNDRRKRRKRSLLGQKTILLHHGSLMVMGGDMQHYWRHGVPKMNQKEQQGPRINITFRKLLGAPGEIQRVRPITPPPSFLSEG